MKKILAIFAMTALLGGCGKFSPVSPELDQKIDNQNGQIEELKNNQNGLMLDLLKLRQEAQINAEKIDTFQQGLINLKGNENSGVQILQGDGALILIFALGTIGMLLIYHYRTRAVKSEKVSDILTQQVVKFNDKGLDDKIFLAALNTNVEKEMYNLFVRHQSLS